VSRTGWEKGKTVVGNSLQGQMETPGTLVFGAAMSSATVRRRGEKSALILACGVREEWPLKGTGES